MLQLVPLLNNLRLFDTDDDSIERRFKNHLERIRLDKFSGEEDSWELVKLTPKDRKKIKRRADRIIEARSKFSRGTHLTNTDKKLLKPAMDGVRLLGPRLEHEVDEIASTLYQEMPWLQQAINEIWLDMRHSVGFGEGGLKLKPTLLVGGAGLGKTHLVRRLADLCGLPTVHVDGGAGSEGFPIAGLTRGWGGAECGRPLKTMLSSKVANPVVVIDEIDKAGTSFGTSGTSTSMHASLLGLLEPVSAVDWPCPYYQLSCDMSRINWLMTANDVGRIPGLLLSRLRIIHVNQPSTTQMAFFLEKEVFRRKLPESCLDTLKKIADKANDSGTLSVRLMVRLLDELQRFEALPIRH